MKKVIIATMLLFFSGKIMNAQIKIVGNEYMDSLTATKNYYNRDIDFDAVFPSILPKDKKCLLEPYYNADLLDINLTGDTIFLPKPYELRNQEFAINSKGKAVSTSEIPAGYYFISGYVFCIENENSAREAAGLTHYNYGYNYPNDKSIHELKKEILLKGNKNNVFVEKYLRYVVFTTVDTIKNHESSTSYYCQLNRNYAPFHNDEIIYLRFYNEACKFIGSNMVYGSITYDSLRTVKEALTDDITGDPIKLNDNSYIVKDVVMKESSLYLILQGEKTGSFAQKIEKIVYGYDNFDFLGSPYGREKGLKNWDVAGFLMEFDRSIYWLSKKDVETIYKRPKIAQAQRDRDRQLRNQQLEKRKQEQSHLFKQQMIGKYGVEKGNLVGNHQITIGMTTEMVRDAWERPLNTYRTTTSNGQCVVWCYNYKTRVYFYDGKVVRIDD